MQFLSNMDCSGRSNIVERETDLADDLSHEDHSDEDMRDCDSIEGEHLTALAARTSAASGRTNNNNNNNNNNCGLVPGGDINYSTSSGLLGGNRHSPNTPSDLQMNHHHHHHQFSSNHPLNALGNFMGMGLHGLPNLQHNDVLEKLKMQVRDMKVMEQDYAAAHAAAFGGNILPTPINTAFSLPPTSMASFGHAAAAVQNISNSQASNILANGSSNNNNNNSSIAQNSSMSNSTPVTLANGNVGNSSGNGGNNMSFSFTSPTAPSNSKDGNLASNSSTSSEASNSSQQNNGWSFEEQYKQVRQLYEINDDPKRKEFLDDLFSFMQKRGTPINRLPIMAKSVLDLYELYNLVIARGGLVDVINKKLWQEIIKGLHLPSSITSAAFTLRTQYMKFLYPYECEKKNLSSPAELQAAIDGNRREGRRSSYGQYEGMHSPMQMQQMSRSALPGGMQQMSPLALVTHAAAANNQQAQAAAAAAAAAHHRLMAPTFGQVPNLMASELEQRMMEYLKLIQVKKEQQSAAVAAAAAAAAANNNSNNNNSNAGLGLTQHQQQQHQQQHQLQQHREQREREQRQRSQSPEITPRDALNALEMSRVALWQMYHNNTSPPASVSASPQGGPAGILNKNTAEPQRSEALNLSDSPPNIASIKRERDRDGSPEPCDRDDDFNHQPPPAKRNPMIPAFPGGFWPSSMAAAAAAANFHQSVNPHDSDDGEHDEVDDDGEHNTTVNSTNSLNAINASNQQSNGHHLDLHQNRHNQSSHHNTNHNNNINNSHHHLLNVHNQSLHNLHRHNSSSNLHLHNSDNKSDDSAIEHSPSTSGGNIANGPHTIHNDVHVNNNDDDDGSGNLSPISTKKIHLNKNHQHQHQQQQKQCKSMAESRHKSLLTAATPATTLSSSSSTSINLFSGLQFQVEHNGLNALGEPQLLVNLHLNGIKYSGILLGDAPSVQNNTRDTTTTTTVTTCFKSNNNHNKKIADGMNVEQSMEVEEAEAIVKAGEALVKEKMVNVENNNDVAIMRLNSTKDTDAKVLGSGAGSEEADKHVEELKTAEGHNEMAITNARRQTKHSMETEETELEENDDENDMVEDDDEDEEEEEEEAANVATKTVAEIISSGGLAISGLVAATAGLTTTTSTTTSTPQLKEALLTSSS